MKRFIARIIIFFGIVAVVDVTFGVVCRYLNSHAKGGDTANHYNITNTVAAPVLVLGSSRAIHHYNPEILEDSLDKEVYNCGVDGNGILFQYGRLAMMLERYKPQMIIYDAITSFDMAPDDNVKYLGWLKRWYGHAALDSLFVDIAPMEKIKLRSNLYRFNGSFIQMLSDYIRPMQDVVYNGWKPLQDTMSYTSEDVDRSAVDSPVEWQDLKLKYFRKMIDLCREYDIKLVVVYSPWYMKMSSESYQNLTKLCRENDIPVFDYYDGSIFNYKAEYFADQSHLNATGANAFSKEIAHRLKLMF